MDSNFNLQQIEYEIQIRNNKIYSKVYFSPGKLEMMNEQIKGHLKITTVNGYYIKLTSDPGCDAIAIWSGLVPGGKVTFSVVSMSKHHYNLCFEIIMIIPTDFTQSCFIFFFLYSGNHVSQRGNCMRSHYTFLYKVVLIDSFIFISLDL